MKKRSQRFTPRFYSCGGGDHFHLLTGPSSGGVSPAFVSREAARGILAFATDKKSAEDIADARRLAEELGELKLWRGSSLGGLYLFTQEMESVAFSCWNGFLMGDLSPDDATLRVLIFAVPCDFVGKGPQDREAGGQQVNFRTKKVQEVLKANS